MIHEFHKCLLEYLIKYLKAINTVLKDQNIKKETKKETVKKMLWEKALIDFENFFKETPDKVCNESANFNTFIITSVLYNVNLESYRQTAVRYIIQKYAILAQHQYLLYFIENLL